MIPDAFYSDLPDRIQTYATNFLDKDEYARTSCPAKYGWKKMPYILLPATVYLTLTSRRIIVTIGNKYTAKPNRYWGTTGFDQVSFDEIGNAGPPQLLMTIRGQKRRVHLSEYFRMQAAEFVTELRTSLN